MRKKFLGVKDITLMGRWARIQAVRSQYRDASTVPFLGGRGQSSGNMIQVMMLTVDVAPKLKFNEGSKIPPW